jgi:hypothetical protein
MKNAHMRPRQPGETLPDVIRRRVLEWPQWSRAEREGIEDVLDEILAHCSGGDGNEFIAKWCERYLYDLFQPQQRSEAERRKRFSSL